MNSCRHTMNSLNPSYFWWLNLNHVAIIFLPTAMKCLIHVSDSSVNLILSLLRRAVDFTIEKHTTIIDYFIRSKDNIKDIGIDLISFVNLFELLLPCLSCPRIVSFAIDTEPSFKMFLVNRETRWSSHRVRIQSAKCSSGRSIRCKEIWGVQNIFPSLQPQQESNEARYEPKYSGS